MGKTAAAQSFANGKPNATTQYKATVRAIASKELFQSILDAILTEILPLDRRGLRCSRTLDRSINSKRADLVRQIFAPFPTLSASQRHFRSLGTIMSPLLVRTNVDKRVTNFWLLTQGHCGRTAIRNDDKDVL